MLGALAVGADGLMSVRRSALAKALEPLEALAFKLERAMENAALGARLLRAEKLAGLGLMAGGMAHALNNPLTAVLGFAELIVATTSEARVKEDAGDHCARGAADATERWRRCGISGGLRRRLR